MDKKSKIINFITSKKFMNIIGFLGIYLLVSGISLAIFSFVKKDNSSQLNPSGDTKARVDLTKPKTEVCPINGLKFTKEEKEIWEKRRPIAAMIENHVDSRPASGLSKADVIYEAVAEGGITRFLGIFYCNTAAEEVKIAPVRSARVYYIDYASEYGDYPIFMHVGGANNYSGSGDTSREVMALELLEKLGWRVPKGNDFDTTYDAGFPIFWRNYERLSKEVATEHTMMASLDAAYAEAEKREFAAKNEKGKAWDAKFVSWNFVDDKAETPVATNISFKFWDNKSDYDVNWQYDSSNNQYLRFNGGEKHVDFETKQQLAAKNVVILFAKEKGPVDRNFHMFYTTTGKGEALVFQNGIVIKGSWEKDSRAERTKFLDAKGKEISFVRGQTWIEIVPAGNEIEY